jgi:hypothetical protein
MSKSNESIAQKQARARRMLAKATGDAAIDAASELAAANIKTMTVEQAHAWAREFIAEHPKPDAVAWAWRMVGQVEMFQEQKRGPKPMAEEPPLSEVQIKIIRSIAANYPAKPSPADMARIEADVAARCFANMQAAPNRAQLRAALRRGS